MVSNVKNDANRPLNSEIQATQILLATDAVKR